MDQGIWELEVEVVDESARVSQSHETQTIVGPDGS
jgi:hypothetical protein